MQHPTCFTVRRAVLLVMRVVVFLLLGSVTTLSSVRDNEILYIGGTVDSVSSGTKGRLTLLDKDAARFVSVKGSFDIPYKQIKRLGYGEKVSRRIVEAITISPWFILSTRHQHIISIEFSDGDRRDLVTVFEVGKDNIAAVATVLENRSGLKFEFESKEAEKDFRKRDFRPRLNESDRSAK